MMYSGPEFQAETATISNKEPGGGNSLGLNSTRVSSLETWFPRLSSSRKVVTNSRGMGELWAFFLKVQKMFLSTRDEVDGATKHDFFGCTLILFQTTFCWVQRHRYTP